MSPVFRRWTAFNAVGAAGVGVQLGVLAVLVRVAHLPVLAATALAVEAAVLHNFAWHQRWTWKDRPVHSMRDAAGRLARFHVLNGLVSLAGNLLLVALLTRAFGADPVAASACAIVVCALLNFMASERLVFRSAGAVAILVTLCAPAPAHAALADDGPTAATVAGWTQYTATVEQRFLAAPGSGGSFFTRDWRPRVSGGRVATGQVDTPQVPDGRIHHWTGAVFIPGVTLDAVLARLHDGAGHESEHYADVIASRLLQKQGDHLSVYMKLRRSAIITVTYNTEHDVQYRRLSRERGTGHSVATRIAELADAGTPREREKPAGDDSGFLWRLNAYWRYEEMDGGVLIECESVSLSRNAPFGLRTIVNPIVERIARESLETTLGALRGALSGGRS
jgi:putative flippase GtrA